MEWIKSTEGFIAALVTIIGGSFTAFKFLQKPNEDNALQTKEIEGIRGAIALLGTEHKEQLSKVSDVLEKSLQNQEKILDAVRTNEKEMAVMRNEVAHQGKEIDLIRSNQTQIFDKIIITLDKVVEALNQKTK